MIAEVLFRKNVLIFCVSQRQVRYKKKERKKKKYEPFSKLNYLKIYKPENLNSTCLAGVIFMYYIYLNHKKPYERICAVERKALKDVFVQKVFFL